MRLSDTAVTTVDMQSLASWHGLSDAVSPSGLRPVEGAKDFRSRHRRPFLLLILLIARNAKNSTPGTQEPQRKAQNPTPYGRIDSSEGTPVMRRQAF
jgi:hypothetical protein